MVTRLINSAQCQVYINEHVLETNKKMLDLEGMLEIRGNLKSRPRFLGF